MGELGCWEPSPSGATESTLPGIFRPSGARAPFALQPTAHAVGYRLSVLRTCRTSVHFGEETLKLSQPWKTHLARNDQIWIVSGLCIPKEQGLEIVVHISRHNGCISYLDRTR